MRNHLESVIRGGGLPPLPPEEAWSPEAPPPPEELPTTTPVDPSSIPPARHAMLDHPKLNDILASLPGATMTAIN